MYTVHDTNFCKLERSFEIHHETRRDLSLAVTFTTIPAREKKREKRAIYRKREAGAKVKNNCEKINSTRLAELKEWRGSR